MIKTLMFLLIGTGFGNLLYAQQPKMELDKNTPIPAPPASNITSVPSPMPVLNPMNGVETKVSDTRPTANPSPDTKEKITPKTPVAVKPVALTDVPAERNMPSPPITPVVTGQK